MKVTVNKRERFFAQRAQAGHIQFLNHITDPQRYRYERDGNAPKGSPESLVAIYNAAQSVLVRRTMSGLAP